MRLIYLINHAFKCVLSQLVRDCLWKSNLNLSNFLYKTISIHKNRASSFSWDLTWLIRGARPAWLKPAHIRSPARITGASARSLCENKLARAKISYVGTSYEKISIYLRVVLFFSDQLSRLHMILKPFMLRRIKRDVENELSDKV